MNCPKRKIHLCDTCLIQNIPECIGDNVEFGDGIGDDNILFCENYEKDDNR